MVLPPFETGGVNVTDADPFPAVAVPMVGAPGTVAATVKGVLPVESVTVASVEEKLAMIV